MLRCIPNRIPVPARHRVRIVCLALRADGPYRATIRQQDVWPAALQPVPAAAPAIAPICVRTGGIDGRDPRTGDATQIPPTPQINGKRPVSTIFSYIPNNVVGIDVAFWDEMLWMIHVHSRPSRPRRHPETRMGACDIAADQIG